MPLSNLFNFEYTYLSLPDKCYTLVPPTPVAAPSMVIWNNTLATDLGLSSSLNVNNYTEVLSGNAIINGSKPFAQAYAGHQFGHFTMLGDGRAHVLGEHRTPQGALVDIQLKGSGITPYSRRGDGRATLSAMLREYVISEAMHYLCIPTTRSLAVVSTGQEVVRTEVQTGAVLTRVAQSHLRVGTFEYVSHWLGAQALDVLVSYALHRHYEASSNAPNKALALLEEVMNRQAQLITEWMRVGFIHGVMNTDNMSISGQTIDYGPCAFMNVYNPDTVFSSIDQQGRYAFGNQPSIAHWNLSCLAQALLPLIDANQNTAIELAKEALATFPDRFRIRYYEMMKQKLGLVGNHPEDGMLMEQLLDWMQTSGADYTNTFMNLSKLPEVNTLQEDAFKSWYLQWRNRIATHLEKSLTMMQAANPVYIPRNHLVEEALYAASELGNLEPLHALIKRLQHPYDYATNEVFYTNPPQYPDSQYKTYCGT